MGLRFDKCCCCIDLKSGCLIIGYLQLITEIIYLAMLVVALVTGGAVVATADKGDDQAQDLGVLLLIVAVIGIVCLVLLFAMTITLLVGLHKDKPGHLKIYLIFGCIILVMGLILFFASLGKANQMKGESIGSNIVSLVIYSYFLLVIRSHYLNLAEGKGPAVYNTA